MKVEDSPTDVVEVAEHEIVAVEGNIQYDKIWRCKFCGGERVDAEYFTEFDCDPNASVEPVSEHSWRPKVL